MSGENAHDVYILVSFVKFSFFKIVDFLKKDCYYYYYLRIFVEQTTNFRLRN